MEYTAFLDFWFRDRPVIERVEALVTLGIRRVDVWSWRQQPMAELAAECRRLGANFNSTFDDQMGSLADPGDNELTLRSWAESLEMAERHGVEHLYVFSNQVDVAGRRDWSRRLSANYSQAEQYANLLRQTGRILKLAEQTRVTIWVEALNEFHIQGGVLVHNHALAADWVRRFNHPHLRMVFDCYHQQRDSGNLTWGMEQYAGLYDVFHIADVPTRQEPGTGEINFAHLRRKLGELAYEGLVGLELYPSTSEAEAFEKIKTIFPLM
jgi:hydroxypyruvate isomerase